MRFRLASAKAWALSEGLGLLLVDDEHAAASAGGVAILGEGGGDGGT